MASRDIKRSHVRSYRYRTKFVGRKRTSHVNQVDRSDQLVGTPGQTHLQPDALAMARVVRQDLAVPERLISQVCLPVTAGASTAHV